MREFLKLSFFQFYGRPKFQKCEKLRFWTKFSQKVLLKQKVAIIERHMTPFWKEERWGYKIYQNEQNYFLAGPPILLSNWVTEAKFLGILLTNSR